MRQQHKITTFQQLCVLFNAGYGEFHFFNTKTSQQFNLKFRSIKPGSTWSYVLICFSIGKNKLFYYNIGRYDFKLKKLELRTEQVIGDRQLKMFVNVFDYMVGHINIGKPISIIIEIYYSGHCCRCGAELRDAESLKLGLGPECLVKNQKEWSEIQFDCFTRKTIDVVKNY